jgi:hypothetical protein
MDIYFSKIAIKIYLVPNVKKHIDGAIRKPDHDENDPASSGNFQSSHSPTFGQ